MFRDNNDTPDAPRVLRIYVPWWLDALLRALAYPTAFAIVAGGMGALFLGLAVLTPAGAIGFATGVIAGSAFVLVALWSRVLIMAPPWARHMYHDTRAAADHKDSLVIVVEQ